MTWSKDGNWTYPTGMLWVKHFDLELSRGNPGDQETHRNPRARENRHRQLRRQLPLERGADRGHPRRGRRRRVRHRHRRSRHAAHPALADSRALQLPHLPHAAGRPRALVQHPPAQSRTTPSTASPATSSTCLRTTVSSPTRRIPSPPSHATSGRTKPSIPLEQRARSYFAVNCAYCHQAGGSVGGFWDGRAHLTLEQTGLINGDRRQQRRQSR